MAMMGKKLAAALLGGFLLVGPLAATRAATTDPARYEVERLVPPSVFHGVHGLRFDLEDNLFAVSVFGQSLYSVNAATGKVGTVIGAPQGEADDLAVSPTDGGMVWTSILQGVIYKRVGAGPSVVLTKDVPGVNSIAFTRDGKRLFAAQITGPETLWEIDYSGVKPPRAIARHIGGLNAFDVGPDGKIYGPLYLTGKIVKIDPDTGQLSVLAAGFENPSSAKFDSKGNFYVEDAGNGEIFRLDIKSGARTLLARLRPGLDNLALDSKDRIFVSNNTENGIQQIDSATGAARQVVRGVLTSPGALAVVSDGDHDMLYIADRFDLRSIDGKTGEAEDIARNPRDSGFTAVAANDENVVMPSSDGTIRIFDRKSRKFSKERKGARAVGDLQVMPDGSIEMTAARDLLLLSDGRLVVADSNGNLLEENPGDDTAATILFTGFKGPLGLAWGGNDTVFASESAAGQVSRVDLRTGAKQLIASGLKLPKGVAVTADGAVLVVEVGARQLIRLDPGTGEKTIVAADLPIGFAPTTPGAPLEGQVGVGVGKSGIIYVVSNVENSVYKITPRAKTMPTR